MISDLPIYLKYRVSMIFILLFIVSFLPLRYKRSKTIMIAVGCFVLTGLVDYVHLNSALGLSREVRYIYSIILILLTQGTALLMSQYRDWRALFTGITASAYVLSGDMMWNLTAMYSHSYLAAYAVQIAVHSVFLYVAITKLRDPFLQEAKTEGDNWFLLSSGPALFYMLTYTIIYNNEDSTVNISVNSHAVIYLILLMIVCFVSLVQSFERKQKDLELMHDNMMLKNYASALKHESVTMRQNDDRVAMIRHDMRHINQTMNTYLETGEIDKAKGLLNMIDQKLDDTVTRHFCSNVAINGVLAASAARARNLGVQFECKAEVPEELTHVNEYEFAAVMANLTENAITAASDESIPMEQRNVRVSIKLVKIQLAVEVSNPYAGELTIDKRTGLPASHGGEGHGYGLRSVQMYAKNTGSIFQYHTEGGRFTVSLLTSC